MSILPTNLSVKFVSLYQYCCFSLSILNTEHSVRCDVQILINFRVVFVLQAKPNFSLYVVRELDNDDGDDVKSTMNL